MGALDPEPEQPFNPPPGAETDAEDPGTDHVERDDHAEVQPGEAQEGDE